MTKLALTNEIGAALLAGGKDVDALVANPKDYILSNYNIELGQADVTITKNEADVVNLTLPYYSQLEKAHSAALADYNLDEASGGELIIFMLLACLPVSLGAGAAIATGVAVGVQKDKGLNLDGSKIGSKKDK